jgi:hypothetical protein
LFACLLKQIEKWDFRGKETGLIGSETSCKNLKMTIAELQSKWHFASRKDPLYFIPSIILPLSIMPLSCIMDYSATAHLADNVDNKDRELSPDKRHFHIPLTWTLHSGKPTMESWTIRIKQYCMTLTTYTRQSAKNSKSMTSMTMTDNQQAKPIILNNSH